MCIQFIMQLHSVTITKQTCFLLLIYQSRACITLALDCQFSAGVPQQNWAMSTPHDDATTFTGNKVLGMPLHGDLIMSLQMSNQKCRLEDSQWALA